MSDTPDWFRRGVEVALLAPTSHESAEVLFRISAAIPRQQAFGICQAQILDVRIY